MSVPSGWVLLAYRLPREPSTPRAALWRSLRRLGAVQIGDGLVALPDLERSREQFGWLADEVIDAGGTCSVWVASLIAAEQDRVLRQRARDAAAAEYRRVTAGAAAASGADAVARRRCARQLRRELQRIAGRDFFPPPERDLARAAVRDLELGSAVFDGLYEHRRRALLTGMEP